MMVFIILEIIGPQERYKCCQKNTQYMCQIFNVCLHCDKGASCFEM